MDLRGEGGSILRSSEYGQFLKTSGAKLKAPVAPQSKVKSLDASLRGQKIRVGGARLDVIPEEDGKGDGQPLIGA